MAGHAHYRQQKWFEVLAVPGTVSLLLCGPAAAQLESGTAVHVTEETIATDRPFPTDEPEIQRMRIQWSTNDAFGAYTRALNDNQPTVLLFIARPCGFCVTMAQKFRCPAIVRYAGFMEFALTYRGEDEGGDRLATALNIQRYPTTIILQTHPDKLHVVGRIEGVFHADEINEVIQESYPGAVEEVGMHPPDLLSVEETRIMLDQAGIARPSEGMRQRRRIPT